jgi:hypothetical protein
MLSLKSTYVLKEDFNLTKGSGYFLGFAASPSRPLSGCLDRAVR